MIRSFAPALLALALFSTGAVAGNDFWQTPTIHGAGRIHPMPQAAYQPDRQATYKVVFSLGKAGDKPTAVSPSLDHVARAVNLYVNAGVPLSHLKFVAIAAGPATPIVLNDAQYRKKYGVANPNLPLIAQLRKAGVDVAVCAQAVAEHDFQYDWVDPQVTVALSGLTTVIDLQQQGYALSPQ
ncbi:sulfur reduction protein DsrE [Rhodanobacter sp. Root561]|uniref:DsrE family protein n=1 Tax=Rhodanobacter sp. Root561 TaxID=1736560 RepID=UPI0006FE1859|nr:DsrE family protein [Rhodanobacter sp. Root561]KQZ79345.1 sulfur reduction protein DsrE [Rhodanobacter sp. Root561]